MMSLDRVLKAPIITEKGTLVSEKGNQVVFRVDTRATKNEVAVAVVRTGVAVDRRRNEGAARNQCPGPLCHHHVFQVACVRNRILLSGHPAPHEPL